MSKVAHEGYGYKYPSDLRSPQWLASNSLYFDARLTEFLIHDGRFLGTVKYLSSRCMSQDGIDPSELVRVNVSIYFNLAKFELDNPCDRFERLKYNMDDLFRIDS